MDLTVFYVIVSLYLALFLSLQDSNIEAIFPIWGPGKLEIFKESSLKTTLFADFFILTIIIPYMTSDQRFSKRHMDCLCFRYVSA